MKNYFLDNTLFLSDVPNGPFAEYGHMVQKAPRWMANDAERQEKRGDYISQKANILFLQGPNVSIAIQQDAFVPRDRILQRARSPKSESNWLIICC